MKPNPILPAFIFLQIFACFTVFGGNPEIQKNKIKTTELRFIENKAQWDSRAFFKVDLPVGSLFLEKSAFTYVIINQADLNDCHKPNDNTTVEQDHIIHGHAFKVNFEGSNAQVLPFGERPFPEYHNYFLGDDPSHWASNVNLYHKVTYPSLYPGIDLLVGNQGLDLKYEFRLSAGADPSLIRLNYEGTDGLSISDGRLIIKTSVDNIIEQAPFAYQVLNGDTLVIPCQYSMTGYNVAFSFPEGYRNDLPLVIDPVVVGATYAGSVGSSTYGHCATYDAAGNIFMAGNSFGTGYPITTGSFQVTFAGNNDLAISKLNPTATTLLWATYLGGSSQDYANSLIVNDNDELFVYGSTLSTNFPHTSGCFQSSNSGSTDIFISHFSADGSSLIGSTYIGGSIADGQNTIAVNYGDAYRGEIILDNAGNPLIASFTSSNNFPITNGCYNSTYNGQQDAVVFKLNDSLTTMLWSTYLGGSGDDVAYGLKINASGQVCITGGTYSTDFPTTAGSYQPNFQGGIYDGFITILNGTGTSLVVSTYFGTSSTDENFFIETNTANEVYIFGLTAGNIAITTGCYGNANSPQFIAKLDSSLSQVIFSTTIGNGTMSSKLTPTAFFVDACENIYAAGWGNTYNYPVSANAIQGTTDGEDFYVIALDANATQIRYATYFGAPDTWEHVDGGTSRFDRHGKLFEASCEGSATLFPTTPGAYADHKTVGWDLAVFVIDFQLCRPIASIGTNGSNSGCPPFTVDFTNYSTNAEQYIWNFGDGSPSVNTATPTHTFQTSGTYQVSCIAIDSSFLISSDTTTITINVLFPPGPAGFINGLASFCSGTSSHTYFIQPINHATSYEWSLPPGTTGNSTSDSITVYFSPNSGSGMLSVKGINSCGIGTSGQLMINLLPSPLVDLGPDQIADPGVITTISASVSSGTAPFFYSWNNVAITTAIDVSPAQSTYYSITVSDLNNCSSSDSMLLIVSNPDSIITTVPDLSVCEGYIEVPVHVSHFKFVASFSLSLEYNDSILIYSTYLNLNPALSQGNLVISNFPGKVVINWYSLNQVTIGEGLLLNLIFNGVIGNTNLSWDLQSPGNCQYTYNNTINIPSKFVDGSLTIGGCGRVVGYITYDNSLYSRVSNIVVGVMQNNSVIKQDTTDFEGVYDIANLPNGSYQIQSQTNKPWGGSNSVDALTIMKHFAGIITLSGMKLRAADVDASGFINSVDALQVMRRYVGLISSFPGGDWLFENDSVTVFNTITIKNLMVICNGDANGSYVPGAKESGVPMLKCKGTLSPDKNSIISIPFVMEQDAEISSISMVMGFAADILKITDVKLEAGGSLVYNVVKDQLRLAWYSLEPLKLYSGDPLFTIQCELLQTPDKPNPVFTLETGTIFSDFEGLAIPDLQLSYPEILINTNDSWLEQNNPNPFHGTTEFLYNITEEAAVTIKIFNLTGECLYTKNIVMPAGKHTEELNAKAFSPGIYFYTLEAIGKSVVFHGMKKVIVTE